METQSLSILEYARIMFRRKWVLLGPWFIIFTLFTMGGFFLPRLYESSTLILVEEEKVINPLISGLAVSTSVQQRWETVREEILGWNRLVELVGRLHLDKDVKNPLEYEKLIINLQKNIFVKMRGPQVLRIVYRGEKPETVQQVVSNITDIFINENLRSQGKEADIAIGFIEDQLKVYKRKIKEVELARYKEQLNKLLLDATEQHPMVTDLRTKIENAEKDLNAENSIDGELPKTSPLAGNIQQEIDNIKKQYERENVINSLNTDPKATENLYAMMVLEKLGKVEALDTNVNEKIYNMLLERLETARITQRLETTREGTRFKILDPARLPLKPTKPNKLLISFMGFIFGGIFGIACVFGAEYADKSFKSIEDAKAFLTQPILGAVSKIATQEEIETVARKERHILTAGAVVVLGLVILTVVYSLLQ